MKELIKQLVETFGPSGNEEVIRAKIADMIKPYVDEVSVDRLGNLIAKKHGKADGKKIMLAAHMDEIGVVITHIDDNGFLRFGTVGGLSPFILTGQRVQFKNGTVGVFGHEKLDDIKDLKADKMYIDIGQPSKEEAAERVSIGDFGSIYREMTDLGSCVTAKSLDDRIGCAVLLEAAKRLAETNNEIYYVFTVQEEVGARGAKVAAFALKPDVGIAVDVTATGDTPEAHRMEVKLGKGAAIKVKDRSLVAHPQVKQMLVELAEEKGIPYQMEVLEFGGTDAGSIHLTGSGIPSGVVSIPCRYVHTPSEIVSMEDVEACVRLVCAAMEADLGRWL